MRGTAESSVLHVAQLIWGIQEQIAAFPSSRYPYRRWHRAIEKWSSSRPHQVLKSPDPENMSVALRLYEQLTSAQGEKPGTLLDNLNRAERLGLIDSAASRLPLHALRNKLIHEYLESTKDFAGALNLANQSIGDLGVTYRRILVFARTICYSMQPRCRICGRNRRLEHRRLWPGDNSGCWVAECSRLRPKYVLWVFASPDSIY